MSSSSGLRALSKMLGMTSPTVSAPFPPHVYGQTNSCRAQARKTKLRKLGLGGQRQ